jgi:hypothetical protein
LPAAGLLEGKGWLALAEEAAARAATAFEGAVARWHALGHPYDEARALSGLNQALARTGDESRAQAAAERGMERVNALGAELADPELKASFLVSALARELTAGAG